MKGTNPTGSLFFTVDFVLGMEFYKTAFSFKNGSQTSDLEYY